MISLFLLRVDLFLDCDVSLFLFYGWLEHLSYVAFVELALVRKVCFGVVEL